MWRGELRGSASMLSSTLSLLSLGVVTLMDGLDRSTLELQVPGTEPQSPSSLVAMATVSTLLKLGFLVSR